MPHVALGRSNEACRPHFAGKCKTPPGLPADASSGTVQGHRGALHGSPHGRMRGAVCLICGINISDELHKLTNLMSSKGVISRLHVWWQSFWPS